MRVFTYSSIGFLFIVQRPGLVYIEYIEAASTTTAVKQLPYTTTERTCLACETKESSPHIAIFLFLPLPLPLPSTA